MTIPRLPEPPKMPQMPQLDISNPLKWKEEWQKHNEEWQKEVKNYQLEVERYQKEQDIYFKENYDTRTYTDEHGFSVREARSKDGKNVIIIKSKSINGNIVSDIEMWSNGKKIK